MNPKRFMPLVITLAVVILLTVGFMWVSGFWTDILWYRQLGYLNVLLTQWYAIGIIFLIAFFIVALPIFFILLILYKKRPVHVRLSAQLREYQKTIEPIRVAILFTLPVVVGVLGGIIAANQWPNVLLFLNSVDFGRKDPVHGMDMSFYVFSLPFLKFLITFISYLVGLCLLTVFAVSYLYGAIRFASKQLIISVRMRIFIGCGAAVLLLLQALGFWLDRFFFLAQPGGKWAGALYTDVNARIPGLTLLSFAAVIVAILFLITAFIGRWLMSIVGVGALVISSLLISVAYPSFLHTFQVAPNEQEKEAEFIQHNISNTRYAYGIDSVNVAPYAGVTTTQSGQLRQDAEAAANIRILDPSLVSPTYAQFEQEKAYYTFPDELDVGRYKIDGKVHDTVLALREINIPGLGAAAQTWVNQVLVYTHGYGLVAGYGNRQGTDGQPVFFASGMPQQGHDKLGAFEPRIYFGEHSPLYSIVGGSTNGKNIEFDFAKNSQSQHNNDPNTQAYVTFKGSGGPSVGGFFERIMYALKFQSEQILLSDAIGPGSQILYNRHPLQRVQAAAPYLRLDNDPYPAVVNGRIVWIVDGYTTTDSFPYSTRNNMQANRAIRGFSSTHTTQAVNYIRNSVKATVDAYDGKVTLYAWDDKDPILSAWQKIFPSTLKKISDMPGALLQHVRYPQDLFELQRKMLATYHVTNAADYYSQSNAWQVPADPVSTNPLKPSQPAYYLTMRMPGQEPAFSLYSAYIPFVRPGANSRNVLTGYLAANSDAGDQDGKVSPSYGKLTLLQIKNDSISGPGQVQNIFNSNTEVGKELNLLEQGGRTAVNRGNLLTLPVGGGFLFVQPVYVKSQGDTSYPLLRRILVAFGDKIAFKDTLDNALDALFGGDSGADIHDAPKTPQTPKHDPSPQPPNEKSHTQAPEAQNLNPQLRKALEDARIALLERTDAYKRGDLVAAAQADEKLVQALNRANAATGK